MAGFNQRLLVISFLLILGSAFLSCGGSAEKGTVAEIKESRPPTHYRPGMKGQLKKLSLIL